VSLERPRRSQEKRSLKTGEIKVEVKKSSSDGVSVEPQLKLRRRQVAQEARRKMKDRRRNRKSNAVNRGKKEKKPMFNKEERRKTGLFERVVS